MSTIWLVNSSYCARKISSIFIEGAKDSDYDKIEIVRSAVSEVPVSNPEGRFLIATDLPEGTFSENTTDIDDIDGIADMLDEMIRRNKNETGQN